jgi:type VI secretion system secreted protein Hcp
MEKRNTNLVVALLVIIAVLGYGLIGKAGNLEPPTGPASTMKTLDEIYDNVQQKLPPKWEQHPYWPQITGTTAIHMTVSDGGSNIEGSCTAAGKEGTIAVVGLGHQVWIPYDPASGNTSGSRRHEPLTILKYIDKSSPLLYRMFSQGNTGDMQLKFYSDDHPGGGIQLYYTITLETVRIVDMKMAFPNVESVSFIYHDITWLWEDGGIEFHDSPYGGGS